MNSTRRQKSERRAEHLLNDLLASQGWDIHRDVLFQHEYRQHPEFQERLSKSSKSGSGAGIPEAIIIDRVTGIPVAVIEVKAGRDDIIQALSEAQHYGDALSGEDWHPLAIGLAGVTDDDFELRVSRRFEHGWAPITYDGNPISWIPNPVDLARIATPKGPLEIKPSVPPPEVLANRAEEMNRLLREAHVKDEFRPAVVAAVMLALWWSKGEIRSDPKFILRDINSSCQEAFMKAGKPELAKSLSVDEANDKLKVKVKRIKAILERLNVTVLTAEHDYLGQLYETFFRYTGGNTIGQYFTPRQITKLMTEVCEVSRHDIVLDPACGTGGFLIASMERITRVHSLSKSEVVKLVSEMLIGFEDEPITAALCVANMILRGDGSTSVFKGDCFKSGEFSVGKATVSLMNPPFPHKKTDTPIEQFVERALEGLKERGRLAVVLPMSLLVKKDKASWRKKILRSNSLTAVCQLPDELFQPFAAANTAFLVIEKGVPHNPDRKTAFVRLQNDGYSLRKGVRLERDGTLNDIPQALDAILNKTDIPGFSSSVKLTDGDEWAPGAHVFSSNYSEVNLKIAIDILLRRLASFYTRYAKEIIDQRSAIKNGTIEERPYREMVSNTRLNNTQMRESKSGTIGAFFDIFYGMKELHSREGIGAGKTLVISPTEAYNGCYGWLEFPKVIAPSFVTVAQTGSIGEAFVQFEPAAVNDDCLVLLPKIGMSVSDADLVLVAAILHQEKWRFTYGRKLTPDRISDFTLPSGSALKNWIAQKLMTTQRVIEASLLPYTED
jgi:type I restriction enzyme M protein